MTGRRILRFAQNDMSGLDSEKSAGSIPAFNSYEEEANFWDTHDFMEFEAETRPTKVVASVLDPVEDDL